MDLICFSVVALVYLLSVKDTIVKEEKEELSLEVKMNPHFYRDKEAFTKYIQAIFGEV